MDLRYNFRLRPGRDALAYLSREWGMCRWVWNRLTAESKDRHLDNQIAVANGCHKDDLPTFGYAEQDKYLTHLRATTRDVVTGEHWLACGSSVAQQQTVRDFARARSKALSDRMSALPLSQQRGLPRFKSRHGSLPSLNYTSRGFKVEPHPETGRLALRLPGKVFIPVVWSRELPSVPKSARVFQDNLGDWYVSFVVQIGEASEHLPRIADATAIGVDWGVTETATTALVNTKTGEIDYEAVVFDLPHKQHGKTAAKRLARYQRMMARRKTPKNQPTTKGYDRAKRKAARAHKKVARQRQDDARKWARNVVAHHDRIAVEDFKPNFLTKSTMAKKAADAAIAATKAELIWQAKKAGRDLRLVHPRNTTTDCSNCDARTKHRLPLGERTYTCDTCGLVRPRDKNSAAVMVVRAGFRPTDVEDVSPVSAAVREPAV